MQFQFNKIGKTVNLISKGLSAKFKAIFSSVLSKNLRIQHQHQYLKIYQITQRLNQFKKSSSILRAETVNNKFENKQKTSHVKKNSTTGKVTEDLKNLLVLILCS